MPPLVSDEYLQGRRDQIIQAALQCFVAKGFSRTTMQDIFAAAQLSPGAVYNYFRSKNDIVVAMAEESLVQNTRAVKVLLAGSSAPLDALLEFLFRVLARDERAAASGGLNLELFSEASRDPRLAEVLRAQSQSLLGIIADVVRHEQEIGVVRPEVSPHAIAQVLLSLWYGVYLGRIADPDSDTEAYAAAIQAAFHGGITTRGVNDVLLQIEALVKEYGNGFRANDGVSLEIEAGEVFGLLGPNGAGKSTLVKQVVGLLAPTSGRIVLSGVDVAQRPDHARQAASFRPQTNVPIDGFTPLQAIELVGRLRGGDKRAVHARAHALLDSLELGEWASKQGQHLSGGVRRLVGFCMAAVVPGDLVILDEPTNDVDPLRRRELWGEIRRLSETGAAVLLVTHNVLEAERAVDRLAFIDQGRVLSLGSPASLKGGAGGSLRLEMVLEPGVETPQTPWDGRSLVVGRRLRAAVDGSEIAGAVAWAQDLRSRGLAEEFSVSPISLEDVYVRTIGRADVLEDEGSSSTADPGTKR